MSNRLDRLKAALRGPDFAYEDNSTERMLGLLEAHSPFVRRALAP